MPKSGLARARKEVQNYRDFRALCDEYVDVCEKIALAEAALGG